ncbi:SsgA family sporulation/cell division regulator [Streptosporangium sp. CA-135522]|uniref:SsgA family sporulation/cell division regulator n=1 Tax=Streptosporangium sp. CA-135522 TaxID=3240072 RepID=UPI003D917277
MDLIKLSTCMPIWQADNPDNFLTVWLHYIPADPWFVRIVVSGGVVSLDVPRDVLLRGLEQPATCEDLKIQPSGDPMWTMWSLRWNPEDPLTFRVPRENVRAFLNETVKLVPLGAEESRVDWDAEVELLLEEAPEGDVP